MDDLKRARYLSLATFRKTDAAVETAVWFAESQGKLYVFSAEDAGKVKRLRNSPRSRVAACDVRGGVLGEWHDTRTTIVTDEATIARAYAALLEKYGWQMRLTDFFSTLAGRIRHRAILEIDPQPAS